MSSFFRRLREATRRTDETHTQAETLAASGDYLMQTEPRRIVSESGAAAAATTAEDTAAASTDLDELSTAFPDFDQACSRDASYFAAQSGDIDEL